MGELNRAIEYKLGRDDMAADTTNKQRNFLGFGALLMHLGLMAGGLAAWLTGLLAGDYKKAEHLGFTVHSWIGIVVVSIVAWRLITGIVGPPSVRFACWMPLTRERFQLVLDDIAGLMRGKRPLRPTHLGLAGAIQALGVVLFMMLAASGAYLYLTLVPGEKSHGLVHDVKELHEIGSVLIPLFLTLHLGGVLIHGRHGRYLWRKVFLLSHQTSPTAASADEVRVKS